MNCSVCGNRSDGWPAARKDGELCQMCWEAETAALWHEANRPKPLFRMNLSVFLICTAACIGLWLVMLAVAAWMWKR